jgi:hypothetical protein
VKSTPPSYRCRDLADRQSSHSRWSSDCRGSVAETGRPSDGRSRRQAQGIVSPVPSSGAKLTAKKMTKWRSSESRKGCSSRAKTDGIIAAPVVELRGTGIAVPGGLLHIFELCTVFECGRDEQSRAWNERNILLSSPTLRAGKKTSQDRHAAESGALHPAPCSSSLPRFSGLPWPVSRVRDKRDYHVDIGLFGESPYHYTADAPKHRTSAPPTWRAGTSTVTAAAGPSQNATIAVAGAGRSLNVDCDAV